MMKRHALIALFVISSPAAAFANSPGQGNSTGAFVTTCGGIGTGGFVQGGESIFRDPPNAGGFGMFSGAHPANCNWATAGITGGSITQSASINTTFQAGPGAPVLNYSASAQGTVKPGVMHLQSSSDGPAAVQFPTGVAQGGWTDQLDISGQNPGTQGILVLKVHVDGQLASTGPFARPGFTVTPYLNGNVLDRNTQFDTLNPEPVIGSPESLGYQSRIWFNPGDGTSPSVPTLSVNGDVFFAIPFTFDVSFNLGLYAYAFAGNGSFGQSLVDNIAESSFQNTVALDGIEKVLAGPGDTPITDYTIETASGLNYGESQIPTTPVPEPATWALLIVGGGLLGVLSRRTSKGKIPALS
jgi:PEP-CTERM motif